jgi:N-acetylglucosamine-6-sulfatase
MGLWRETETRGGQAMAKPNVVAVIVDDMPKWMLNHIPDIRRAYRGGAGFARGYCTVPACAPDRVTILTGKYPHNHGILTNQNAGRRFRVGGFAAEALGRRLKGAGYANGLFGKWLNGNDLKSWVSPGWRAGEDRWVMFTGLNKDPESYEVNTDGRVHDVPRTGRDGIPEEDYIRVRAEAFIRQSHAASRPFFVYYATHHPHAPYFPAPRNRGAFRSFVRNPQPPSFGGLTPEEEREVLRTTRGKLEELLDVGDSVTRFRALFDELGIRDNTLMFFVTDNGYFLGEHGLLNKGLAYEEAVLSPYLAVGGGIPRRADAQHFVATVDLPATICDLAGADTSGFDGRSLRPLLFGAGPPNSWRQRLLVDHPGGGWRALREGDLSYIEWEDGRRELYDLAVDPWQIDNVAAERPDDVADLSGKLAALRDAAGDELRAAEE